MQGRSYTENSKPILHYHSNHHETDRDAHSGEFDCKVQIILHWKNDICNLHIFQLDNIYLCSVLQESERERLLRYQQLIDENEMIERERTRLSGMNLACMAIAQQHYLTPRIDDLKTLEGKGRANLILTWQFLVPLANFFFAIANACSGPNHFSLNHFSYGLDLLNNGATIDSKTRHISEQER